MIKDNTDNELSGFTKNVTIAVPIPEYKLYKLLQMEKVAAMDIFRRGLKEIEKDLAGGLTQNNNA
jgi:hypothetical protein